MLYKTLHAPRFSQLSFVILTFDQMSLGRVRQTFGWDLNRFLIFENHVLFRLVFLLSNKSQIKKQIISWVWILENSQKISC